MGMAPTHKTTVRVVFAATLLWITVLQYVVLVVAREEPYPALVLPGFPAECPGCLLETGTPANKNPLLTVRFAGGASEQVPVKALLPQGTSVTLMAFTAAFAGDDHQADPDVVAWLRSRIDQMFPTRAAVGIDISWRTAIYHAADKAQIEYRPLYDSTIDFGS